MAQVVEHLLSKFKAPKKKERNICLLFLTPLLLTDHVYLLQRKSSNFINSSWSGNCFSTNPSPWKT
jgi:hypothetical protein